MQRPPAQAATPVRPCPLGCPEKGTALGALPVTMPLALSQAHFTLTRCGCGTLLYLSPAPTGSDLHAMYVDEHQFGDEYTEPERVRRILRYMSDALDRIATLRAWTTDRPLRILEIGAGLAWMCRAAKARNPRCNTVAQDVSPEAAQRCAWVDVYVQGELSDPRIDSHAPFDVISMTHVIEHLVDPVAMLRRCRTLLEGNGVLFVTAPFRPQGWRDDAPDLALWRAYSYNHVPAHVQYFSEASMRRLTDTVGLQLVHWSHAHDTGQAFEAWIAKEVAAPTRRLLARLRSNQYVSMCRRLFASNCGFNASQSSPRSRQTSRNAATTPSSIPFKPQM